uniref:XPA-binding protein, putative n=1 Tax=Arundo donax TaxID=35708 RepID=A0A0A9DPR8_ARUDO
MASTLSPATSSACLVRISQSSSQSWCLVFPLTERKPSSLSTDARRSAASCQRLAEIRKSMKSSAWEGSNWR